MTQTLQFGNHPDAESLNAFVEQALPPDEREQVLAHMASCGRCRQVVFLAQEAAEIVPLELVAAASAQPADHSSTLPPLSPTHSPEPVRGQRASWLAGWRWAWIPAAAMAGILSVVVIHYGRLAQRNDQVAQNTQAEPRERKPAVSTMPAKPAPSATPAEPAASTTPTKPAAREMAVPEDKKMSVQQLTAKGAQVSFGEKKSLANAILDAPKAASGPGTPAMGFAAPPVALGELQSRHLVNGMVSSVGGPAKSARFGQQQSAQQQVSGTQQVQVAGARYSAAPTDALVTVDSAAALNGGVTRPQASPSASAAAPVAQMAMKSTGGNGYGSGYGFAAGNALSIDKAKNTVLPSGIRALSVATSVGHTIAIDATGALYLSDDAGKNWVPITRQWTGRAVLVRTHAASPEAGFARTPQSKGFELVTDIFETWVSQDGKTWVLQTAPLK
jgi:hypothetical protein